MSVIRPKGDLLFTLDTYLTADRRTNVRAPLATIRNQTFSLAEADQASIPLDLQRIAVLVSRGSYTPASDGSRARTRHCRSIRHWLLILPPSARRCVTVFSTSTGRSDRMAGRRRADRQRAGARSMTTYRRSSARIAVAAGDAYAVTGLTSIAGPDQLRAAGTDYPSWVTDRYLELPANHHRSHP